MNTRSSWSLASQLAIWIATSAFVIVGISLTILYIAMLDHLHRKDDEFLLDKIQVLRRDLASKHNAETLLRHAVLSDPESRGLQPSLYQAAG